jgi:uncharacterized protein
VLRKQAVSVRFARIPTGLALIVVVVAAGGVAAGGVAAGSVAGCSRAGENRAAPATATATPEPAHVPAPPPAAPARVAPEREPTVLLAPPGAPEARVRVRLARNDAQRQRGLMYVQNLPLDRGMLFVFDEESVHSFWMKNTLIPLDMIFIRGDMTVGGVVESAEPLTETNRSVPAPSRYVLEVNGGWARTHRVAAGTRVRFDNVP